MRGILLFAWLAMASPAWTQGPASGPASPPPPPPESVQDRIISAAEKHLGKPYVMGGRDGRQGCLDGKRRVRCPQGIDCLSLIFFAFEDVLGTPWRKFSVIPSVLLERRELGAPVPGVEGVLRQELDPAKLRKGDVLFFLLQDYNLGADRPLLVRGEDRYGVWHTALVHSVEADKAKVLHANPGDEVRIDRLEDVLFDGVIALRLPPDTRAKLVPKARR
jgi:hypothetical protein